jgi:Na+-transporting methylmalonyl-CoA/oxaloacetate decarboxylase gamma subunit
MAFVLLTLGLLVLLFLIMVALARTFEGHSVADIIDWKPTRSPEVEAQNEVDDVRQMIEAQNELRRKRGAAPITEADVERQAQEDQAVRARGRGPFAQGGGLDDEIDEPAPKPKAKAKARPKPKAKAPRRSKS